jgi:RNA polymerase II subunit A small phosphatase-like protein
MGPPNKNKILLILDLDETLIHATEKQLEREPDFLLFGYNIFVRPFLKSFFDSVNQDFNLAIWSSASDDYVLELTNRIIPSEVDLEFVWGRSRCTFKRNWLEQNNPLLNSHTLDHYHYTKSLKKLKRKGFSLERILIVDDSPHKSKDNFGNAIYPKPFLGDSDDDELPKLAQYLLTLKDKSNVRRIEKRFWRNEVSE